MRRLSSSSVHRFRSSVADCGALELLGTFSLAFKTDRSSKDRPGAPAKLRRDQEIRLAGGLKFEELLVLIRRPHFCCCSRAQRGHFIEKKPAAVRIASGQVDPSLLWRTNCDKAHQFLRYNTQNLKVSSFPAALNHRLRSARARFIVNSILPDCSSHQLSTFW
jgi:hypothetical protein